MISDISQQFADRFEKAIAISRDTLPTQLVMLAGSISEPRVSCLEIYPALTSSIKAVLRQIFYGVLHEEQINQEIISKRTVMLLYLLSIARNAEC